MKYNELQASANKNRKRVGRVSQRAGKTAGVPKVKTPELVKTAPDVQVAKPTGRAIQAPRFQEPPRSSSSRLQRPLERTVRHRR